MFNREGSIEFSIENQFNFGEINLLGELIFFKEQAISKAFESFRGHANEAANKVSNEVSATEVVDLSILSIGNSFRRILVKVCKLLKFKIWTVRMRTELKLIQKPV